MDVHLWTVLGGIPILHYQRIGAGRECLIEYCAPRNNLLRLGASDLTIHFLGTDALMSTSVKHRVARVTMSCGGNCQNMLWSSCCCVSLLDILVIDHEEDGHEQQQDDADHDELVGGDAPRHARQHAPRFGDVVVCAVQRISCMRYGLPLPMQVLQNAHPQLLRQTCCLLKDVSCDGLWTSLFATYGTHASMRGMSHAAVLITPLNQSSQHLLQPN